MHLYLDVPEAALALAGNEKILSLLFSARGSYQRGGFAPWPLFECAWNDGLSNFRIVHNTTNQIRMRIGQINLDATPFSAIGAWHHYRLILSRSSPLLVHARVYIDGTLVWVNECASEALVVSAAPSLRFRHAFEGSYPHASFGYILAAPGMDLALTGLDEIGASAHFDPFRIPPADEKSFAFERLPPVPKGWTYRGDKYPFRVFPDGKIGLDKESLPFSKNRVLKATRTALTDADRSSFDALVDPSRADGKKTFATIAEAAASLKGGRGRIFLSPGIYAGTLEFTGDEIALVGGDPFTTVITGFASETNGIRGNVLVRWSAPAGACLSFTAENISFYNRGAEWNESVGYGERRGAALCVENIWNGQFTNCLFLGRQDTLYLKSGIMRFDHCYVEGDIDYICGGATAFFSECHLHSLLSPEGCIASVSPLNEGSAAGARPAGDAAFLKGFTFYRCILTMDALQKTPLHLGRGPWLGGSGLNESEKEVTRSFCSFVECEIGTKERPFLLDGDCPWRGMDRDWTGECYGERNNRENGEIPPSSSGRPQLGSACPE